MTRLETQEVFKQMQSGREEKLEMTFEESFDVFGGTLRPIMDPSQEFERMKMGSLKLLETNPANIVKLMARGTKQAEEDYTHALFSESGGGVKRRTIRREQSITN